MCDGCNNRPAVDSDKWKPIEQLDARWISVWVKTADGVHAVAVNDVPNDATHFIGIY